MTVLWIEPKDDPTEDEEAEGFINENDGILTLLRMSVEC
jgi:hypothetical protein